MRPPESCPPVAERWLVSHGAKKHPPSVTLWLNHIILVWTLESCLPKCFSRTLNISILDSADAAAYTNPRPTLCSLVCLSACEEITGIGAVPSQRKLWSDTAGSLGLPAVQSLGLFPQPFYSPSCDQLCLFFSRQWLTPGFYFLSWWNAISRVLRL